VYVQTWRKRNATVNSLGCKELWTGTEKSALQAIT